MADKKSTTSASQILRNRFIEDDRGRKASVEEERVNTQVAQTIYDRRTEGGLTQADLAKLVGTTQSVISRLEDSDYEGHSLAMLCRIAEALDQKMTVIMTPRQ